MSTATATAATNPNFTVLAIHGKARVGKSTLAEMLCTNDTPRTSRTVLRSKIGFADPIKEIASKLFQWDGDKTLYKMPDGKVDLSRGRGLLLGVGNSMRATYPDIWAAAASNRISASIWHRTDKGIARQVGEPFTLFVIDDLRLMNEVEVLKKAFPGNVRFVRMERAHTLIGSDDPTEQGLDGFSEWYRDIDNNGTKEALADRADDILDNIIPLT